MNLYQAITTIILALQFQAQEEMAREMSAIRIDNF